MKNFPDLPIDWQTNMSTKFSFWSFRSINYLIRTGGYSQRSMNWSLSVTYGMGCFIWHGFLNSMCSLCSLVTLTFVLTSYPFTSHELKPLLEDQADLEFEALTIEVLRFCWKQVLIQATLYVVTYLCTIRFILSPALWMRETVRAWDKHSSSLMLKRISSFWRPPSAAFPSGSTFKEIRLRS